MAPGFRLQASSGIYKRQLWIIDKFEDSDEENCGSWDKIFRYLTFQPLLWPVEYLRLVSGHHKRYTPGISAPGQTKPNQIVFVYTIMFGASIIIENTIVCCHRHSETKQHARKTWPCHKHSGLYLLNIGRVQWRYKAEPLFWKNRSEDSIHFPWDVRNFPVVPVRCCPETSIC